MNNLLSILWMFLLPLTAILLPVWLGQRYGYYSRKKSSGIQDAPVSSAVGATLGLFAFMLAFTFQIVGERFDKRKDLFLNEIAAIRTCYQYAGLVPEPFRSGTRRKLHEYVDIRFEVRKDMSKYPEIKERSEQILDSIWNYAEALAAEDRSSEAYSLFTASIGELISLFNQRISINELRIPQTILYVLCFVAFFSMVTLGYQFGLSGSASSFMNFLLGLSFAAVMWLIFALDHPEAGIIQISESPLRILQQELQRR